MAQLPALANLDIGMADATDVAANQIATELDLGLRPSLPAVATNGAKGIVASATSAIESTNAMIANVNAKLQKTLDVGNKMGDALASAIVSGVDAAKTIALQSDTADLKAQTQVREINKALGGFAAQVDRAKDAREFEIKAEALSAKRSDILDDKHTGISIIDNVINEFRVQRTESALKATLQEAAVNKQAILDATSFTEAASQTSAFVKQTANEGTIVANQKAIAATGQIELNKAIMVQNRSQADILQSTLSNSSSALSNIMTGFALQSSEENRKLAREKFNIDVARDQRQATLDSLVARRNIIALKMDKLALQQETDLAPGVLKRQKTALAQDEINLERSIIALQLDDATFEDAKAASIISRAQAEVDLDISLRAFNKAVDDDIDPEKIALAKDQLEAARSTAERTIFENEEFKDQARLRLATRQGAKDAQDLQIKAQERSERVGAALESGQTANALAELEQTTLERADLALVRANNTEHVRSFQSKIFGAAAMEDAAIIQNQLDNNNPVYQMMRQLDATAPLDSQGNRMLVLGSTPDKSVTFLNQLEDSRIGIISNDLTPVRILREVRDILQKEDEKNPKAAAQLTETGLAIRFNKTAREYMEGNEADTVWNDVTNPLMPLSIPDMVELSKGSGIAAQPLFTKVLIPNGNVDANPDSIISSGIVAINAKTLSQEQVVEGIVAWGNSIAINNNINHHGPMSIGLPPQSSVNMRVLRPRGFLGSVFDDFTTAVDQNIIPVTAGAVTIGGVLAAPITGGVSLAAAGVLGTVITGAVQQTGIGAGGVGLQGSDTVTLNITDSVAVTQYIAAIRSSSTLGGVDTDDTLDAAAGGSN